MPTGDEEEEEDGSREERLPSCFDYVMHFLTVFWKVLFACVPPTEYCHGWACFVVSILIIGMLTAIIGDLASHFGCTIGLKDSVTAVVFVAFGTSVPGKSECAKGISPGSNDPWTLPHLRYEATGTVGNNQFTHYITALLIKILDRKTEVYQGYRT